MCVCGFLNAWLLPSALSDDNRCVKTVLSTLPRVEAVGFGITYAHMQQLVRGAMILARFVLSLGSFFI